jgi:hypothetical protein
VTVTDGSPLTFTFSTRNLLDRPLSIHGGTAFSPCCSSIGPLPTVVPPEGRLAIPVVLKTKGRAGQQQASFEVTTDDPKRSRIRLDVVANLVEECELVDIESDAAPVIVGRPAARRFRLVLRRKAGAPTADYTVVSTPSLAVSFDGTTQEHPGPSGTLESWQDLLVSLPASTAPGRQVGELRLKRHDGSELARPFFWEVIPTIQATPKGLVLNAADGAVRRTILVHSSDGPIRIIGAEGAVLDGAAPLPEGPAESHRLDLTLAPSLASHTASNIEIITDHPGQPKVSVSVIVLR